MQLSDMRGMAPQFNWSKDDGQCIVALGEGYRLAVWDEGSHWTISVDTDGGSFEMDVMGFYTVDLRTWEDTTSVLQLYTDEQLDDIACEVSQ